MKTPPSPATVPLVEVKGMHISFHQEGKRKEVVRAANWAVHQGETLAIVGESGSGKSVSALALMGLLSGNGQIDQGELWFQPREGDRLALHQCTREAWGRLRGPEMGMVFQEPMSSLNPVYTCGRQVAESLRLHKNQSRAEARSHTLTLFEQVELPGVERMFDAYPHQLSGGQKQRVMIAMAMACEPRLLIADEPTTALDVTVQKRILMLLQDIQQRAGMGMIFITHDLGVVAEIADRVLVMRQGECIETGPTEQIFQSAQHPYTQGLIGCRPRIDLPVARLLTVDDFLQAPADTPPQLVSLPPAHLEQRLTALQSQAPLLFVKGLKTYFGGEKGWFGQESTTVRAVDDVSFEVFPGETLGLVGESGSGKTTLGRSILALQRPTAGEVIYGGQDLIKMDRKALRALRRKIQIIFQDPFSTLNPRMTIEQALMEPMLVHGLVADKASAKERVAGLLERVQLPAEVAARYPHAFSGGQRQRISIARALAVSPDFIVCDESVSALDVSVQASILNLLKDLQAELGLTYLFISHDLSVVRFMSDRIMVMQQGKLVELGAADQICAAPQQAYTRELLAAVPPGSPAEITTALEARKARFAAGK